MPHSPVVPFCVFAFFLACTGHVALLCRDEQYAWTVLCRSCVQSNDESIKWRLSRQRQSTLLMISKPNLGTFRCVFVRVSLFLFPRTGGLLLADALTAFSYDILRVVIQYAGALYITLNPGDKPKFLFKFGQAEEHKDAHFSSGCFSLACSPHDDSVWCGDSLRCQVFTMTGQFLRRVAEGQFAYACTGMAFDNGFVFMADYDASRVVVCRPDGSFVRSFGSRGRGQGQLNYPYGSAANGKGLLFVAEQNNHRVSVFRRDGSFVQFIGESGEGDGQFHVPLGVAVQGNELFIADTLHHRIQVVVYYFIREPFIISFVCLSGVRNQQRQFPASIWQRGQGCGTTALAICHRSRSFWSSDCLRIRQPSHINLHSLMAASSLHSANKAATTASFSLFVVVAWRRMAPFSWETRLRVFKHSAR